MVRSTLWIARNEWHASTTGTSGFLHQLESRIALKNTATLASDAGPPFGNCFTNIARVSTREARRATRVKQFGTVALCRQLSGEFFPKPDSDPTSTASAQCDGLIGVAMSVGEAAAGVQFAKTDRPSLTSAQVEPRPSCDQ
jgi:hypothetical protein